MTLLEKQVILDRDLQRRLLEACADIYPQLADPMKLIAVCDVEDHASFTANVAYLKEHALLDAVVQRYQDRPPVIGTCLITAKGLDFLAEDGGLSAILDVVTVKLHADTIREMLLAKAEASALAPEQKSALRKQISALPGALLQTVTTRLVQQGLAEIPDLLQWIRAITGL